MTQEFKQSYDEWVKYLEQLGYRKVVLCKDCKHYSKEDEICLDMFGGSCNEDGYCAWAERKDND